MNKTFLPAAVLAATLAMPMAAAAEATVTAGGAVNFGFDDSIGHTSSTVEAFVEFATQGFHAGLWVGTLYEDPTDDFEYELSLGYGGEVGKLSYDISAIGYFLSDGGYQSTGIGLELGTEIAPGTDGTFYIEADVDSGDTFAEVSLSTDITDTLYVWGMVGTSDANNYGEVGLGYSISDSVGVEFVYEDATDGDGTFSLSLAFEVGLLGG